MKIRLRLFASVRERVGQGEMDWALAEGLTVGEVWQQLTQAYPQLSPARVAFAVNQVYAPPETVLQDGDEVALIPPVSGG